MAQSLKPFISERRLRARVRAMGRAIRADYKGRDLVLVGVLKGSFVFMADLARAIGERRDLYKSRRAFRPLADARPRSDPPVP